jgi:hypothetical protein
MVKDEKYKKVVAGPLIKSAKELIQKYHNFIEE